VALQAGQRIGLPANSAGARKRLPQGQAKWMDTEVSQL
jgi:hypothetical protein